jgi:hypothetical protein
MISLMESSPNFGICRFSAIRTRILEWIYKGFKKSCEGTGMSAPGTAREGHQAMEFSVTNVELAASGWRKGCRI